MVGINKQKNILDFALSSLLRRWKKNLALVMVYAFVVFIVASVIFLAESIKREARLVLADSPDMIVQRLMAGRHDLISTSYIDRLAGITGVSNVRGRLWAYYFEPSTGANYTLLVSTREPLEPGFLAIGQGVARTMQTGPGDLFPLQGNDGTYTSFEVSRVFEASSELVSADLIEISEADFRGLFGIPTEQYTDITLDIRNVKERFTVADKIKRLLPDTRPILRDEILRTYEAVFDWRGGLILMVFTGAIAAFLILAWDKAAGLSFEEKHEMGVLKATGWETAEVIAMKSWEGVIISVSAFLTGFILAYLHIFLTPALLFAPVLKGWAVLYPQFQPIPFIDPYQVTALFFLTVAPYIAATIIPSWKAATIDPDAIMRA